MNTKVLFAGGGIFLSAIIPFATLSNFSNSTQVQAAQQYSDLSSQQDSTIERGSDLSSSISADSGQTADGSIELSKTERQDTSERSEGAAGAEDSGGGSSSQISKDSYPPSRESWDPDILKIFTPPSPQEPEPVKKPSAFKFSDCKQIEGGAGRKESFTCSGSDAKFDKHTDLLDHYLKNL